MPKKEQTFVTVEHHRRPRSLEGLDDDTNKAYVDPIKHRNWHVIFGNMNAHQICDWINHSDIKPSNVKLECMFINGHPVTKKGAHNSKSKTRCQQAWIKVFGENTTFEEQITIINHTWIDGSYRLKIVSAE